jgi:hypothetical protein
MCSLKPHAEETFDPVKSLKRIKTPVLLLDGRRHLFSSRFCSGIGCHDSPFYAHSLSGKGHEISNEKRFGEDIMDLLKKGLGEANL